MRWFENGTPLVALGLLLFLHPSVEAATLGVFFDPDGTQGTANPPRFTTTNEFWVLGFDLDRPYDGYEFSLIIDPNIIVFAVEIPPGATDLDGDPTDSNWIVQLAACTGELGIQQLARADYGIFDTNSIDLAICVAPASPSNFDPLAPGYSDCDGGLWPFAAAHQPGGYRDGCGVLYPSDNPCDLPTQVYQLEIADATADPGALVPVPVRLTNVDGECALPLGDFDGVELTVQWDPTVASLESVEPVSVTQGWSLTADIETGSADVLMETDTLVTAGRDPADWLILMFRAALPGGSTDLWLRNGYVLREGYGEYTMLRSGTLTVLPVATEQASFGALKSRY
jgi:hypothetical protein